MTFLYMDRFWVGGGTTTVIGSVGISFKTQERIIVTFLYIGRFVARGVPKKRHHNLQIYIKYIYIYIYVNEFMGLCQAI